MNATNQSHSPPFMLWALLLGGSGFVAGFFGPIALNPDANQGPMLGIFITGPGGAVAGVVIATLMRLFKVNSSRQWQLLLASTVVMGLGTLYCCFPSPVLRGTIIDAKVESCMPTENAVDPAIADWDKRIASVTWAQPRAGWKQDVDRMLQSDPGVVITMSITRRNRIYEHRKPWNRGRIFAAGWTQAMETKSYFVRGDTESCDDVITRPPALYLPTSEDSTEWPPKKLPNFLGVEVLEPLPGRYQTLIAEK